MTEPLHERTREEVHAYAQGYQAALRDLKRHWQTGKVEDIGGYVDHQLQVAQVAFTLLEESL